MPMTKMNRLYTRLCMQKDVDISLKLKLAHKESLSHHHLPLGHFLYCSTIFKKFLSNYECFERSNQLFLLVSVEILEFCRNKTLKGTGKLSNYSLVIPSSFSLSTILKVLKFSPSFEIDFVTRKQQ